MDTSKVVLVQPPIHDFYLTKKRTQPCGLASVAAGLRHQGFIVDIFDALATSKSKIIEWPSDFSGLTPYYGKKDISLFSLFHEFRHFGYSLEHIGSTIKKKSPFVVGISSLFTAYADQALETAKVIKRFHPECTIVMGGHHPTRFPEAVLEHPSVDIVLQGEGETGMAALCLAIKENQNLDNIPGIAYKKDNKVIRRPPAWEKDLDRLPLPDPGLFHPKFYRRKKKDAAIIVTSRGCPMSCSYCSVSASSDHARFRQKKADTVVDEIYALFKNRDIGFIDFEDENLCLKKDWFLSVFSRLTPLFKKNDVELRAMNGLYPPSLDREIVKIMAECGFKTLNLSLGSACAAQLKKFRRPDVRAAFEKALCLAGEFNLECVSYLIAAAPDQTPESSLDDLLYLAPKPTLVGLSVFYPAPGSLDYTRCAQKGLLPETFSLMRSSALPISHTTTRTQAATLLRLSRILNFMKHLMDNSGSLPEPLSPTYSGTLLIEDRETVSIKLLQYFLYDGLIRGITPEGKIFDHHQDHILSSAFLNKLRHLTIAGVRPRKVS